MGTVTGTAIMNKAATLLYDVNNIKWSRPELLIWVNDAQRAITSLLPEASSAQAVIAMAEGPRQSIPATGWLLLEVTDNMGTSPGSTRGRAVKKIDRATIDETNPNWYDATPATAITAWMQDGRDRTAFQVYPPSDGTGYLEVIHSLLPVDLAVEADTIVITDLYTPAMLDYVMFRCMSKGGGLGDPKQAEAYLASFNTYVAANTTNQTRLVAATD